MKISAEAKINLFLDVTGKRDDGFHEIRSIMHSVTLCDYVSLEVLSSHSRRISIVCGSSLVPSGRENLVYRAAEEFFSYFHIDEYDIAFEIEKNIPVAAGLAGGSTDAAAALKLLAMQFGKDIKTLFPIAEKIGSDVPFCLMGGSSVCEGRGEILTPIKGGAQFCFVICKGGEGVSTPNAYGALDRKFGSDSGMCHADMDETLRAVSSGDPETLAHSLYNIFESVVLPHHEAARKIKSVLLEHGALGALLSGSGPSVFGIFDGPKNAEVAADALLSCGFTPHVCTSALKDRGIKEVQ